MKIVIGLVGEKGSGKETFVKLLKEVSPKLSISHTRFSDILNETLRAWDIPTNRENLQKLAVIMKDGFGVNTLSHAVYQRIGNEKSQVIILDGVRWETDVKLIKNFSNNILIYITSDLMIRFERLKTRQEKSSEENTTFEQFMKEEKAENELLIPKIGQSADVTIINNTSLDDFRSKVASFYTAYLVKLLS